MVFNFIFFTAFFIAFLLPNHYYPWGSFYLEFSAFFALFSALLKVFVNFYSVGIPRFLILFFLFRYFPYCK
jgi:hypothetical protein